MCTNLTSIGFLLTESDLETKSGKPCTLPQNGGHIDCWGLDSQRIKNKKKVRGRERFF